MKTLTLQRRIAAPADIVFDFLVDPDKLGRWLGVIVDIEAHVGGRFRIDVTGGDITEGEYLTIERPHRVVFTWGWVGNDEVPPGSSTVSFELTSDGDHTVLTLTHAGLPAEATGSHEIGWNYFLARLETAATGGDAGPVDMSDLTPQEQP